MRKNARFWAECLYPVVCAALFGIVTGCLMKKKGAICVGIFGTIMDDVIGVASILIGLLGALAGIVFSLADNGVMKSVMRANNQKMLKLYIEEPIVVGMLVIILTIVYRVLFPSTLWHQAIYLAMTLWLLLSFMRVISILMKQCFIIVKPRSAKFYDDYSREEREKLAESFRKNQIDKSGDE